jgi:hypothetical protein
MKLIGNFGPKTNPGQISESERLQFAWRTRKEFHMETNPDGTHTVYYARRDYGSPRPKYDQMSFRLESMTAANWSNLVFNLS